MFSTPPVVTVAAGKRLPTSGRPRGGTTHRVLRMKDRHEGVSCSVSSSGSDARHQPDPLGAVDGNVKGRLGREDIHEADDLP